MVEQQPWPAQSFLPLALALAGVQAAAGVGVLGGAAFSSAESRLAAQHRAGDHTAERGQGQLAEVSSADVVASSFRSPLKTGSESTPLSTRDGIPRIWIGSPGHPVEHPVDDHAGHRDVEPDGQSPAGDPLVLGEAPAPRRRQTVMPARNGTAAASMVWVRRMAR